jgi:hypothetical protein
MSKNEIHVFSAVIVLFLCAILESAFALDSEVLLHRGTPKLHVNGDIVAPLIFFNNVTHPDASTLEVGWREIRYAVDAGYDLHSTGVRHNLKMPWPRPGEEPDYGGVRETMENFLRLAPRGRLILRIDTDPPAWWSAAHPDDCIHLESGELFGRVSPASEKWRGEAEIGLRRLVRFLEDNYGENVLGYHPGGQGYEPGATEWIHPRDDFGPAMTVGFRKWLEKKYGDDPAALQRAWKTTDSDFKSAALPTSEERSIYLHGSFRDPSRQRKSMDYSEYVQDVIVEVLERFARAIKEESGRRKLVVFFYGYLFEISAQSGHHRLTRILECPDVDILCGPISYGDRILTGTAPFMAPVDSIHLHGKLWLNEDDTRTHLSAPDMGFGRVSEPDHTTWVLRRNFAQALTHRTGAWWMTSGTRGWFDSKELWDDLGALLRCYRDRVAAASRYACEIAVIIDEESALHTHWNPATRDLLYNSRSDLLRIGAPIGFYLLEDLVAGRVPDAKMYVFLNAFYISPGRRRAITDIVCRDGKVSVWYLAPGFVSHPADVSSMQELTGISFRRLARPMVPELIITEAGGARMGGLKSGDVIAPGERFPFDPVFAALEPQENMTVLGRYRDTRASAGLVVKSCPGWTSAFVGSTRLAPAVVRSLAKEGGVHIWLDTGDLVICDGEFLAVHAQTAGRKNIRFPGKMTVENPVAGERIADGAVNIELEMKEGETRLLSLSASGQAP